MGKNESEYEVEALIGKRRKKNSGSVEYRVLWKGYPKDQSTWEPEQHLENVQYMIDEFERKIKERDPNQTRNETPPLQPSTPSSKKNQEDILSVQEPRRKEILQKTIKKITKNTEDDFNEVEDQTVQELKARGITAPRGRPPINRIQEEVKTVDKKVTPPVRNGIKSSTSNFEHQLSTELKRPHFSKIDNEKITDAEDNTGFSSDEESTEILEVKGMFINENGKFGFVACEKKNNRRLTLRRRQLIKKDPMALIRFYEKSLNIIA